MLFSKLLPLLYICHLAEAKAFLDFIGKLDFDILDLIRPLTLSLELNEENDANLGDLENLITNIPITTKKEGLALREFEPQMLKNHNNSVNTGYIKDPNVTYLFKVNKSDLQLIKLMTIEYQPYYYLWVIDEDQEELFEVHAYGSNPPRKVPIACWNKTSDIIQYVNKDIYERRSNFFGSTVATSSAGEPYFEFASNGKYEKFDGKVLQTVQDKFNFTVNWLPKATFGVELANGTWTGNVGRLINNEIDFAPAVFTHTAGRMLVVDPGYRFKKERPSILHKNSSSPMYSFFSLFAVFNRIFWIIYALSCTLLLLLVFIASKSDTSDNWKCIALSSFLLISKAVIGQSTDLGQLISNTKRFKNSKHILIFSISLMTGLVLWIYSGSMVSFLILKEKSPPLSKFDDLLYKSSLRIYVEDGTIFHGMVLNWAKKSDINQAAFDKQVHVITSAQRIQTLQRVSREENSGFFSSAYTIMLLLGLHWPSNDICSFQISPFQEVPTKPTGWLFPQKSMLTPLFNHFQTHMDQSGLFDKLTKKYQSSTSDTRACSTSNSPFASGNYSLVEILFWILLHGTILSFFVLLLERFYDCS